MKDELVTSIQKINYQVSSLASRKSMLEEQLDDINSDITALSKKETNLKKASSFCDYLIETLNKSSVEDIENLITEALQYIFGEPYRFKMNPQIKRGNMTYRFSLEINDREEENLMDAQGGGIICVISILLRVVTILISKNMAKFLLLDESLGMLSDEYIPAASKFIRDLGQKLGFTIVLITHKDNFVEQADVAYKVTKGSVKKL